MWQPLLESVARRRQDCSVDVRAAEDRRRRRRATSGRRRWSKRLLGFIRQHDDRPARRRATSSGPATRDRPARSCTRYRSGWLPARLLDDGERPGLSQGLFAASRHGRLALHLNKGLAGAPPDRIGGGEGHGDQSGGARRLRAWSSAPRRPTRRIRACADTSPTRAAAGRRSTGRTPPWMLCAVACPSGRYVSESDYFEPGWQDAFWGANYPRLLAVKDRYDPQGLFTVHHGVEANAGLPMVSRPWRKPPQGADRPSRVAATATATQPVAVPGSGAGGGGACSAGARLGPIAPGTDAAVEAAIGTCAACSRSRMVNSSSLRTPAATRGPGT